MKFRNIEICIVDYQEKPNKRMDYMSYNEDTQRSEEPLK